MNIKSTDHIQYDDLMTFLNAESTKYSYLDAKEKLLQYLNAVKENDKRYVEVYKAPGKNWRSGIVTVDGIFIDGCEYRIDLQYEMLRYGEEYEQLVTEVYIYGVQNRGD